MKKKRDTAPVAALTVKGTSSTHTINQHQTPSFKLSPGAQRTLSAFLSFLTSSPHPVLPIIAAPLSPLLTAVTLQQQVDCMQQTHALAHAYSLLPSPPSTLSSTTRKVLALHLPLASSTPPLSPSCAATLRSQLCTPLLSLLFHPIKYPRPFVQPFLTLLTALSFPSLVDDVFLPILSSFSAPSASHPTSSSSVLLLFIELALEWPPFIDWSASHLPPFLTFFTSTFAATTQHLSTRHHSAAQADGVHQDEDGQRGEGEGDVAQHEEEGEGGEGVESDKDLVAFLRLFILFLLRHKPAVHSVLCSPTSTLLPSLLHSLVALLSSDVVGKDPLTQSALLLLILLHSHSSSVDERLTAIHHLFISPSLPASLPSHPVLLAFTRLYKAGALTVDWFDRLPPLSRLAVYRAMVTQSPLPILLHPLVHTPPPPPPEVTALHSLPPRPTLYFHVLLPRLLFACHSPSPQLRYYAFQVLDTLLAHTRSLWSSSPSPSLSSSFHSAFPSLLAVIGVNWEHPYRVIVGVNAQLFQRYIDLLVVLAAPTPPSFDDVVRPLVQAVLARHDRGAYHMLHSLLPHLSAVELLTTAGLLPHVLTAATYQPLWGLANALLQKALNQAWEELSERPGDEPQPSNGTGPRKREGRGARRERRQKRIEGDLVGGGPSAVQEETGSRWRALWLPEVVRSLMEADDQERSAIATTLVIFAIKLDPHALPALLSAIQQQPTSTPSSSLSLGQLRALITVLTTGRRAGLISSHQLHASLTAELTQPLPSTPPTASLHLPITRSLLLQCLLHADADLRLEAFEFVCSNLYASELPSLSELELLRCVVPFTLKVSDPSIQAKFLKQAWQRLLVRIRDSVGRLLKYGTAEGAACITGVHAYPFDKRATAELSEKVRGLLSPSLAFLRWLCGFLFLAQYPASTYERLCAGLEVFRLTLVVLHIEPLTDPASTPIDVHLWHDAVMRPLSTPSAVSMLFSSIGRSWQTVRWLSYFVLLSAYPAPLPGFSTFPSVHILLTWALTLSNSPRSRDSEAGALALKLLFKKYVQQLHWRIPIHLTAEHLAAPSSSASPSPQPPASYFEQWGVASSVHVAAFSFLSSIHSLLRAQLAVLQRTPLAYRYTLGHGRLHGIVLLFRLIVEEVAWDGWDADEHSKAQWEALVRDMLALFTDIALVSLKLHIPTNAFHLMQTAIQAEKVRLSSSPSPSPLPPPDDDEPTLSPILSLTLPDVDVDDDADIDGVDCRGHVALKGSELDGLGSHLIVVSSWLAIKEVCLALGRWVQVAPIWGKGDRGSLFSMDQLNQIGGLFLAVLGNSKHNGVLENAHAGLLQLCERLLSSSDACYDLVRGWLERLLASIANPDDDSWLRRSRGFAFSMLAMLQAQPLYRPPLLLSQMMDCLLRTASMTSASSPSSWKSVVHALNLLRSIFKDSSLHVDVLPYVSSSLRVSVQGFSDPMWAVRNSALISFVPIALKAIRAQYSQQLDGQSGMSAVDFFSHYPTLQPFLEQQLHTAAQVQEESAMHPKLYPLLLLLAKLKPSNTDDENGATDSFLTSLHALSNHPHAHARRMTAQAVLAMTAVPRRESTVLRLLDYLPLTLPSPSHPCDFNLLDGRLLQLAELFHAWTSQPVVDAAERDRFALRFASALLQRRWIGTERMCIPVIRIAFVSLLSTAVLALSVSALSDAPAVLSTLLQLAAGCCDPWEGPTFPGVGFALMRRRSAAILMQSLLSVPLQQSGMRVDATSVCVQLLADEDDGVKESALRVITFALDHQPSALAARLDLIAVKEALLSTLLSSEASAAALAAPATRALVLQVVLKLDSTTVRTRPPTSSTLSFDDDAVWCMLSQSVESEHLELKVAALPAMGRSLRDLASRVHSQPSSLAAFEQRSARWVESLFLYSTDLQVPELRHACWQSILESEVTASAVGSLPRLSAVVFAVWRVLLRMMSDESEVVRDEAAALAYGCIHPSLRPLTALPSFSSNTTNGAHHTSEGSNAPLSDTERPMLQTSSRESPPSGTCTARVVELAFLHMATHFTPSESTLTFFLSHFSAASAYGQTCTFSPHMHSPVQPIASHFPSVCASL